MELPPPVPPIGVPGAYKSHVTLVLFGNCALPFTTVYASLGVGTDLPVESLQLYGDMPLVPVAGYDPVLH